MVPRTGEPELTRAGVSSQMVTSLLPEVACAPLGSGPAPEQRRPWRFCRVLHLSRHLSFSLGQQGFFVFFVITPQDEADDDGQG
jgi:hypothetical protein